LIPASLKKTDDATGAVIIGLCSGLMLRADRVARSSQVLVAHTLLRVTGYVQIKHGSLFFFTAIHTVFAFCFG